MADPKLENIKRLTIIALVSDDELMDRLVLKGGNAIRLVQSSPIRQSLDLDFSIDGDLGPLEAVREKIESLLKDTFRASGFDVFDVRLSKAPPNVATDVLGEFWGGYTLEFKVGQHSVGNGVTPSIDQQRRRAFVLGTGDKRAFVVDISKYEYVAGKVRHDIDGFSVYVYSPLMIACEKVRAICQQMPEYREIVKSSSARPRARDFFDIHLLCTRSDVHLGSDKAWEVLTEMFKVKRVPLRLLGKISASRDYHRENFQAVRDTVQADHPVFEFDKYVDFLVKQLAPLQSRWEVDSPIM